MKNKCSTKWFKCLDKSNMKDKNCCKSKCCGVYCLGFIGAAVYYIQNATSFWMGVLGVLKAIVWPAILVYKSLGFF